MNEERIYVQYGSGQSCPAGWLNFDVSPTLRLQKIKFIGNFIVPRSMRFPERVKYGDIVKGLPISANSVDAVYASHVLEHLALDDLRVALRNTEKIMKHGAVFRCIVPDLAERARRYISSFDAGAADASYNFMRTAYLGRESRPRTLVEHLRTALGNSIHLWMWDEYSLKKELEAVGFINIRRCHFGDSQDPMFARVEDPTRFVDQSTGVDIEEVAIEAIKV